MTDKEIINQWKHERELAECVCSYFVDQVELSLVNETIDLINHQKAEIERLKECPKCIYEYDGEISEYCVQGPCTNFTTVEKIKSEAYKEFAERIKMSIKANVVETLCNDVKGVYNAEYVLDDIDNLLKEMVGKEQ